MRDTIVPKEHRVLIAAAVAAVCGANARILGVVPVEAAARNQWGRLGRIAIHGSHSLPRKDGITRLLAKQDPGARKK
jgi:hypothetical protein